MDQSGGPNDYSEDWKKWWDVDHDEAERRAVIWHASDELKNMEPVTGAFESLQRLKSNYELIVISGRAIKLREVTKQWIARHFPDSFSDFELIEVWGKDRTVTKADVCRRLGADILIDDSLKQVLACAAVVEQVLLFGNYGWNQADDLPKNVRRVQNWNEVIQVLLPEIK